jgi:hypothetical protein
LQRSANDFLTGNKLGQYLFRIGDLKSEPDLCITMPAPLAVQPVIPSPQPNPLKTKGKNLIILCWLFPRLAWAESMRATSIPFPVVFEIGVNRSHRPAGFSHAAAVSF